MLELDGLTRRYGQTLALDALSLTVRPGDVDEQQLLDAARGAGRVVRFAPAQRSLTELFRSVVA